MTADTRKPAALEDDLAAILGLDGPAPAPPLTSPALAAGVRRRAGPVLILVPVIALALAGGLMLVGRERPAVGPPATVIVSRVPVAATAPPAPVATIPPPPAGVMAMPEVEPEIVRRFATTDDDDIVTIRPEPKARAVRRARVAAPGKPAAPSGASPAAPPEQPEPVRLADLAARADGPAPAATAGAADPQVADEPVPAAVAKPRSKARTEAIDAIRLLRRQ